MYETERQGQFVVLIQAVRTRPGIQPMPEETTIIFISQLMSIETKRQS